MSSIWVPVPSNPSGGPGSSYGPTISRPAAGLTIGQEYFDTDLEQPVFVQQITPTIIWVNASGTPA